jgi:hypothetical protein
MQKIYPNMDDEERTKKAREMFFNSVLQYINENPEVKNKEAIDYFSQIKEKFSVALITTNTLQVTNKILSLIDAPDLFDIIETSNLDEKDDKSLVFDRFLKKHGKPRLYIGGDRKDSFDYCKEHDIPSVFANLENQEEIQNVESAHSLDELKIKIESLIRNNA